MVRELAVGEPLVPVVGRLDEPRRRPRRRSSGPAWSENASATNAVSPSCSVVSARTREPSKPTRRSVVSVSLVGQPSARGHGLAVAVADVLPLRVAAAVVEDRVALHLDLDRAVDAAHRAQQDVVGVVVRGRAAVRARALVGVVPRADQQHVADDQPAAVGPPRGLEDHRARAGSGARRGPSCRPARAGTCPRRGPAARRTRSARRSAAGTSTRSRRSGRRARTSRSRRGSRSPRSAGTARRAGDRRSRAAWRRGSSQMRVVGRARGDARCRRPVSPWRRAPRAAPRCPRQPPRAAGAAAALDLEVGHRGERAAATPRRRAGRRPRRAGRRRRAASAASS